MMNQYNNTAKAAIKKTTHLAPDFSAARIPGAYARSTKKAARYFLCALLAISLLLSSVPWQNGKIISGTDAVYAAEVSPYADHMIRVHLSSLGAPASLSLKVNGAYSIKTNGKPISGTVKISASGSSAIKVVANGATYSLGKDILLSAANQNVSNSLTIGSDHYPGDLRIINKSGGLKLITHIDMETYVLGVVPYEAGNTKNYFEALKAQAVASRSEAYYTMNFRNRATQEHDVVDTTASQVYRGYKSSYTNANKAVVDTACQLLLTPSGGTVYACYSAANGGYTEYPKSCRASDVNYDYLPFKQDDYDLKYSLEHSGYNINVTVKKTLTAANLKSSQSQPYAMIREAMKGAGVDPANLPAGSNVTVKNIVLTNPRYTDNNTPRVYTGADFTLGIPAYGSKAAGNLKISFAPYVDASGIKRPFLNVKLNLANKSMFSKLYLRTDTDSYFLASIRFGHSAGMSQVGAYQMALSKKTYRDILKFYYLEGSKTKLVTKNWTISNGVTGGPVPAGNAQPTTPANDNANTGTYKVTSYKATGSVKDTDSLNVRRGPGTSYDKLGTLKSGAKVTITGKTGNWYRIQFNGASAFVSKDYIKISATVKMAAYPFKAKVRIDSGRLIVRAGAGTKYAQRGSLKKSAKVTILGAKGTWYKIKYKTKTSYVLKKYIVRI